MRLKFIEEYKSITNADKVAIESLKLPDFSILTGTNGSGKTHLLEAISFGRIQVDVDGIEGFGPVTYFNYQDFFLSGIKSRDQKNPSQIKRGHGNNEKGVLMHNIDQLIIKDNLQVFSGSLSERGVLLGIIKGWVDSGSPDKESIIECLSDDNHNQDVERVDQAFATLKSVFDSLSPFLMEVLKNTEKSKVYTVFTAHYNEDYLGRVIFEDWREYHIQFAEFFINFKCELHPKKYIEDIRKEYIKKHGESPLKFFNEVLKEFGVNDYIFIEEFPLENSELIRRQQDIRDQAFMPKLKKGNVEISLDELSSGERTLLAIASLILKQKRHKENDTLQGLLLLDEVDTNLHPSMLRNFLNVIQNVFIEEYGVKVVLVTHSPTTIAFAPKDSIFVMRRREEEGSRIEKTSNSDALYVLTEGFAILDKGIKLLDQVSGQDLSVFTEGHNVRYIKKAIEHFGQDIVNRVGITIGIESVSGKNQLKTLFDFFCGALHDKVALFVWDCDVGFELEGTDKTIAYIFDKNTDNTKVTKGIENLFPEGKFSDDSKFYPERPKDDGGWHKSLEKGVFMEHMVANGTKQDFSKFEPLIKKMRKIVNRKESGSH